MSAGNFISKTLTKHLGFGDYSFNVIVHQTTDAQIGKIQTSGGKEFFVQIEEPRQTMLGIARLIEECRAQNKNFTFSDGKCFIVPQACFIALCQELGEGSLAETLQKIHFRLVKDR